MSEVAPDRPANLLRCPRCDLALDFVGTRHFHEGTRAFVDQLGEELRGEE